VKVPLWLALVFKKRQRCKIQPPEFLELGERPCSIGESDAGWTHSLTFSPFGLDLDEIVWEMLRWWLVFSLWTDTLQKIVDGEKNDKDKFKAVPPHFIEVSLMLLERFAALLLTFRSSFIWEEVVNLTCLFLVISASDDIVNPSAVRILLEDLREIRKSKIREGLQMVGERSSAIQVCPALCYLSFLKRSLTMKKHDSKAERTYHHGAKCYPALLPQGTRRNDAAHEGVEKISFFLSYCPFVRHNYCLVCF